ncbi:MAG TPA: phospholipase D-like domain-containing protein [Ignavibacteria bacterium]|nr:phospholipase D-like domain-containing protein [Ignavibacteria bacterium]
MKTGKIYITIVLLMFSSTALFSQVNNIELVESIPVETTLDNPDIRNTLEVWLEMINSAQKTLDIEQFYISNEKGEPLDTVLNAIITASKRGVIVRVIIDAGMYQTYPETADELDKYDNIEVRKIDFKGLTGGIQHSKYFIVDHKEVFLGSQNFDWRALKHIHELGVRMVSSITMKYLSIFNMDWDYALYNAGGNLITDSTIVFAIRKNSQMIYTSTYDTINPVAVYSPQKYSFEDSYWKWDLSSILNMIAGAESEITLQFLSYNPVTKEGYWEEVDTALISATKRGVKVKLLVSDWNLSKTAVEHFKELIQYPNFEVRYTTIPEYSGGAISYARVEHCKFITADDYTWIGTSNMSYDYFYESRNVGVVVENDKFTKRVREIFYKSWDSEYSRPIVTSGEYTPRKRN